jgi:hypothetical protein
MTVSGKFLPSDTNPTRTIAGVASHEIPAKGDMGKYLPGGEKRFVGGVSRLRCLRRARWVSSCRAARSRWSRGSR